MPKTLVDSLTQLEHEAEDAEVEEREKARSDYVELVARAGKPRKGDVPRLVQVLRTLGISTEEFSADVAAYAEAEELRKKLDGEPEIREKLAEYSRKWREGRARIPDRKVLPKEFAQKTNECRDLARHKNLWTGRLNAVQGAHSRLVELSERHWFIDPPPPAMR